MFINHHRDIRKSDVKINHKNIYKSMILWYINYRENRSYNYLFQLWKKH